MAKLALCLPALLVASLTRAVRANNPPLITVVADAVSRFRQNEIESLTIAAATTIALNSGPPARFVIFRDGLGGTPVAVIVGAPDFAQPVAVRLHSACLTGDVLRLATLRLRRPIAACSCANSATWRRNYCTSKQEGRGLGLVNKIRTYRLQDAGLDTVDANTALGFDDDERDYGVAVRILQVLGCTRVRLLTNNPAKLEGVAQAGIDVSGRVPLHGPINSDNRRYLAAKASRAGHKLDHILQTLTDASPGSKQT